jgi:Tfp pilus assembly protein PilO
MLVLAPQKKNRKQLEEQFAEKKRVYDSALKTAQEDTRIQLNKQLEDLRNELKNFIVDPENLADLTFDISQIANEKAVGSFSIKSKDGRGSSAIPNCDHIRENNIDIRFTGSFNQFATLLNALERHQPVVFVDKFLITRSRQGYTDHKVSMKLSVFIRKKQES